MQSEGYILHRRAYRETSFLLDVLTQESGRLTLLAKGVRNSRKRAESLISFAPLQFCWHGKTNLPIVQSLELGRLTPQPGGKALYCGFYLNELMIRLLPFSEPQPEIYALYAMALHTLVTDTDHDLTLRYFELDLLDMLGYGLQLTQDVGSDEAIHPELNYRYIPDQGPVFVSTARSDSVQGASLLGLQERCLETPLMRRDAKRLMRQVLNFHLGGRPLKSRELFIHATLQK